MIANVAPERKSMRARLEDAHQQGPPSEGTSDSVEDSADNEEEGRQPEESVGLQRQTDEIDREEEGGI